MLPFCGINNLDFGERLNLKHVFFFSKLSLRFSYCIFCFNSKEANEKKSLIQSMNIFIPMTAYWIDSMKIKLHRLVSVLYETL